MKSCINCNNELTNSDKFCPECGQSTNNKLNLNTLFADLIGNYLSFDARFFKTIIPLLLKPGHIARAFIEGKRSTYLHPGKIYLFISVLFFFFLSLKTSSFRSDLNQEIYENLSTSLHVSDSLRQDSTQIDSNLLHFGLDKDSLTNTSLDDSPSKYLESENVFIKQIGKILERKGQNMFTLFFNMISIAIFLLVPVYAFFLKLIFYKTHNFTQNLVFSLYLFAFSFILAMLYLTLYNFDDNDYILFGFGFIFFTYLTFAFKYFYQKSLFKSFVKACIQTFIFTSILVPTTFILLIVASIYFY